MTQTGRPSVLGILAVIVIVALALTAFAFFAVVGLVLLAGLFVAGAVASLFSRGRRPPNNLGNGSTSGPVRVTIIGSQARRSRGFDTAGYGDVIEGEIVEEHARHRAELTDGNDG